MKKKILTLFLAFAIMMTFMPSMAFADGAINSATIEVTIDGKEVQLAPEESAAFELEKGRVDFYKATDQGSVKQCYYDAEKSKWFNPDDVEFQGEIPSLYASHYDYAIVSGVAQANENYVFTDETDVHITYNGTIEFGEQTDTLPTSNPGTDPTKENNTVCWLNGTNIEFKFYCELSDEPITNVEYDYKVVTAKKNGAVIFPPMEEKPGYSFSSEVFDMNNTSMSDPQNLKKGDYYILFTYTANEHYYFQNEEGLYTGMVNNEDATQRKPGDITLYPETNTLTVKVPITISAGNKISNVGKIAIIAAAVVAVTAVVAVVGSSLTGGSKTVQMQQAAYQAQMQQQMVQKQVATIKTVLKGAGVVFSLASFGSSLGNLFQLNQFGFNPFGFR